MKINEIFLSIQGEGIYTGEKMLFIRTEYCNLRCSWCDTKYSFNEGYNININDVLNKIEDYKKNNYFKWICITGGEPLLQRDLNNLIKKLYKRYKILLETSGSLDIKRFLPLYNNVYKDIDFKLPSSNMYNKFNYNNLKYLKKGDYIKFVINDENDFNTAIKEINNINIKTQFIIQPVWNSDIKWLADKFIKCKIKNARLMLQEHKYIYGDIRGV